MSSTLTAPARPRILTDGDVDVFMRTHVSRYVLPKKLDAAVTAGRANVSVPTADAARLVARVGGHTHPVAVPDVASAALPDTLGKVGAQLVDLFDWEPDGEAILTREQVADVIMAAVRAGFDTPRPVRRAPAKAGGMANLVAAAVAAEKTTVSVSTEELARALAIVDAQRAEHAAQRLAA